MKMLSLPHRFSMVAQDYIDFDPVLRWFEWTFDEEMVRVDFRSCESANFQSLALLVLYIWHLRVDGKFVEMVYQDERAGTASSMWSDLGARGWSQVLYGEALNFEGNRHKPLIAVRGTEERQRALRELDEYTANFDINYRSYLTDIANELLYNTLEHGQAWRKIRGKDQRIPSLIQFSWYEARQELSVMVADLGVGIKAHLEKTYPAFESDEEAIRYAMQPETSGTFGAQSEYSQRNNAGVGLYVSTQLMQRLRSDMWIVSGDGQVHVSPREITSKRLESRWPGTLVLFTVRLRTHPPEIVYEAARAEIRENARKSAAGTNGKREEERFVVSVVNFFGRYPEDKPEAIRFRDKHLLPAVQAGKPILLDFRDVVQTTHSFLNALLSGPIRAYADKGMNPYKYVRVANAPAEIRESVDFVLDTNT